MKFLNDKNSDEYGLMNGREVLRLAGLTFLFVIVGFLIMF